MSMIVVGFEDQLREAFNAGRAAGSAPWIAKQKGGAEIVTSSAWLSSSVPVCNLGRQQIEDQSHGG